MDGDSSEKAYYSRGFELISQERNGGFSVYLHDGHGNVRALTGFLGNLTDSYSYDAWGNLLSKSGDTANSFLYCGEHFDETTGLYYLRARYMNPTTGTFVTMDTYQGSIFDPASLHKYLYCRANLVMRVDPSGYMDGGEATLGGQVTVLGMLRGIGQMLLDAGQFALAYLKTFMVKAVELVVSLISKKVAAIIISIIVASGSIVPLFSNQSGVIDGIVDGEALPPALRDKVKTGVADKVRDLIIEDETGSPVGPSGYNSPNNNKKPDKGSNGNKTRGTLTGSLDGLTGDERRLVEDLLSQGKNVEIIPRDPNAKTPDFKVNGVTTELKTLQNPNTNTGMKRIQDGFKQNADTVIVDARNSGLTSSQAREILERASGKYPNGQFPGSVEIWINGGVIT